MIDLSKPYVSVTLDDGEQKVEAHNFADKSCQLAVADIQKILGGEITSSAPRPMASAKPQVSVSNNAQVF